MHGTNDTMETEYYKALILCANRYIEIGADDIRVSSPLFDFILEFHAGCDNKLPIPKLCRWLGYIQGQLIAAGVTTVEDERNWTRPLFRPLDFPVK